MHEEWTSSAPIDSTNKQPQFLMFELFKTFKLADLYALNYILITIVILLTKQKNPVQDNNAAS
jgi:hypothetical protein